MLDPCRQLDGDSALMSFADAVREAATDRTMTNANPFAELRTYAIGLGNLQPLYPPAGPLAWHR
jgi:hypothetical protein